MGLRTHYYHQSHGFLPAHCWIIQRTCINEFNFLCTHLSICSFQLFYYPSCLCIFSLYSWSALQSWESGDSAESSSSFLISWNWQCWEKNRPIPLAPTHSEPSTICLNTLKGRQNDPSARLSLPPLWRFGISRSIAVGRLILLGVPACHTLRRYFVRSQFGSQFDQLRTLPDGWILNFWCCEWLQTRSDATEQHLFIYSRPLMWQALTSKYIHNLMHFTMLFKN